jgi:hypothetical protein
VGQPQTWGRFRAQYDRRTGQTVETLISRHKTSVAAYQFKRGLGEVVQIIKPGDE